MAKNTSKKPAPAPKKMGLAQTKSGQFRVTGGDPQRHKLTIVGSGAKKERV
jgi:hypothetical protein